MSNEDLNDAEYQQALANHQKLQDALNGPRGAEVGKALDDFVDFPPKTGKVK